ncbi:MAG: hypothetical protein CMF62_01775 [Magnetococcales bacterium]|nr:hypothetical protein [Magnetococcales bacterium]|tara:strand:+ start:82071 stop:82955 length:885 start_codon:yes stop_codon:yes gene_type:complete
MNNRLNITRILYNDKDEIFVSDNYYKILDKESANQNEIISKSNNKYPIDINEHGDLFKFINISMDYNENLEIDNIKFLGHITNLCSISYEFIKIFYSENIFIKKNRLIINMSFFHKLLCDFNYPILATRISRVSIELIGKNINNIKISCDFTYLDSSERQILINYKNKLIFNNILKLNKTIQNNKYLFHINNFNYIKGFFIKNFNIHNLKKINLINNKVKNIICEEFITFESLSTKYKNGYYFSFTKQSDLVKIDRNAILEFEMENCNMNFPDIYLITSEIVCTCGGIICKYDT